MKQAATERPDARGVRLVVLRAAFNAQVVEGLAAGVRETYLELGGREADLTEVEVPGAFELPLAARAAAASGRFDAAVALGAVIRGETDHYEHVAREAAAGLTSVSLEMRFPMGFGVLTVREEAQALARAEPGPENKGAEAVRAALAMVHVLKSLHWARTTQPRWRSTHESGEHGEAQDPDSRPRRSGSKARWTGARRAAHESGEHGEAQDPDSRPRRSGSKARWTGARRVAHESGQRGEAQGHGHGYGQDQDQDQDSRPRRSGNKPRGAGARRSRTARRSRS